MANGRAGVPQLIECNGANAGRVHLLPYGIHVLGRSNEVTIPLEHEDVSRRHAELQVGPDDVQVRDLESKNGLRVDGEVVHGTQRIVHGQIIELGDLKLRLNHPSSHVTDVLARAGEPTVTKTTSGIDGTSSGGSLLLPLFGVAIFAALTAAMLWL